MKANLMLVFLFILLAGCTAEKPTLAVLEEAQYIDQVNLSLDIVTKSFRNVVGISDSNLKSYANVTENCLKTVRAEIVKLKSIQPEAKYKEAHAALIKKMELEEQVYLATRKWIQGEANGAKETDVALENLFNYELVFGEKYQPLFNK